MKVYKIRKIYTDGVHDFEYFLQWKYSKGALSVLKFWWSTIGKYSTFEEAFNHIPNNGGK